MKRFFLPLLALLTLPGSASPEKWNRWIGLPLLNEKWHYEEKLAIPGQGNVRSQYLKGKKLCGQTAHEIKIRLDGKTITEIEIVFSNKGDTPDHVRRRIKQAGKGLREDLNKMIGKPSVPSRVGTSRFQTKAEIWQTEEIVFALEADAGEYLILHITPPEKRPQVKNARDIRKKLDSRDLTGNIKRNDFGDVYLVIPQVDQGDKGYCVPATFCRVLQYYGIDSVGMHQLAARLKSDAKEGTILRDAYRKMAPIFRSVGISTQEKGDISFAMIQKSIDKGEPLLWSVFAQPKYEDIRRNNTKMRGGDPNLWRRKKIIRSRLRDSSDDSAHLCLIVGYNLLTEEIAVSNSWKSEEDGTPTWVPFSVAKKYSMGETYLCRP